MSNALALVEESSRSDTEESAEIAPTKAGTSPLLLSTSIVLFLASGVCQPLLMSGMKYSGLADPTCQIYMLPYALGMAAVGLLTFCIPSKRWCAYPLYLSCGVAFIDIISQILNYTGNNYAGSAIFAVVYASVSIWCAVLSRVLLGRVLTWTQWFTVLVVFLGLAITALDAEAAGGDVMLGTAMVFVGAMLHALMYVLSEWISTRGAEQTPPHIHCSTMAIVSTCLIATWQSTYTAAHFDKITVPVEKLNTSTGSIVVLFVATAFANFVHSATFFFLLKWIGAVSAAVMKGIQAALVFVMADLVFCDYRYGDQVAHSQCWTRMKGVALVVVLSGAFGYAYVTAKPLDARALVETKGVSESESDKVAE